MTGIMITRAALSLGLLFAVLGMFLDWVTVDLKFQGTKENFYKLGLYDRLGEALPWFKWCKAGAALTVIFTVMALVATFFHTSHPYGAMVMAIFASLCAWLTVIVYIVKMNSVHSTETRTDPISGLPFTIDSDVYSFGFIMTTIAAIVLMGSAFKAMPRRQYHSYDHIMQAYEANMRTGGNRM